MIISKIKNYLYRNKSKFIVGILVGAALAITSITFGVGGSNVVLADNPTCSGGDASWNSSNGQPSCVTQNCDAISARMDRATCVKAIQDCQRAGIAGVDNADLNPSYAGSCSNAVRSCAQVEVKIDGCKDGTALNKIKDCSNGNIGANGSDCGLDAILGPDRSNAGVEFQRLKDANDACVKKYSSDPDKELACKKAFGSAYATCYGINKNSGTTTTNSGGLQIPGFGSPGALGGGSTVTVPATDITNQNFTDEQYKQCMQKNATDPDVCGQYGGTFTANPNDPTKGTCATPPPPPPTPDQCDTNYPIPANGDPGYAKASDLNSACKAGESGKDCAATYPGNSATGTSKDELQAACNKGADYKDNVAQGPGGNITPITNQCGEARVNILACGTDRGGAALNNVLKIVISVLSAIIGIASVGGLVWASVLYAKAGDNEGNVSEAKTLIRNIVIGILVYAFLLAIIGWLVPGSVIS